MFDRSQAQSIIGQQLFASDGAKVGKIGQVYLDDVGQQPEWVTVNTGFFGTNESFVPLADASVTDDGVTVPYDKDQIKNAPNIDESGHLSEAEERQLYEHYGVSYTDQDSTYAAGQDVSSGTGRDTSGPATDDAMTRSEERLQVDKEQVPGGRARLRKYIVTENVTQTVPVSREEVRVEREPVTDANRSDALDGPDLSEEEHEVTLNQEQVVTRKETVPVERVRLEKDVVEDQQQVDEDVRKEVIDVDAGQEASTGTRRDRD